VSENTAQNQNGLASQLEALGRIEAKHGRIAFEAWLLTFLLIALDTSAVAMKLMESQTRDERLRAIGDEQAVRAAEMRMKHNLDRLGETFDQETEAHAVDLQARQVAAEDIAEALAQLSREGIDNAADMALRNLYDRRRSSGATDTTQPTRP
jgi:hypothetical protein